MKYLNLFCMEERKSWGWKLVSTTE